MRYNFTLDGSFEAEDDNQANEIIGGAEVRAAKGSGGSGGTERELDDGSTLAEAPTRAGGGKASPTFTITSRYAVAAE